MIQWRVTIEFECGGLYENTTHAATKLEAFKLALMDARMGSPDHQCYFDKVKTIDAMGVI